MNIIIALTAIANGKSRAIIACVAIKPAFTEPGPPNIVGIKAMPIPLTKIKTLPANKPGAAKGKNISLTFFSCLHLSQHKLRKYSWV